MNSRQHWLGPSKTRHGHLCSGQEDGVAEVFRSSMGGGGGVGGGQRKVEGDEGIGVGYGAYR